MISHSFMQFREILQPMNLNPIRSWISPVRNLPYLFCNHIYSDFNIILFLIIFIRSQISQPCSIPIVMYFSIPYAAPKSSTSISIRFFTIVYLSVQLLVNLFLILLEQSVNSALFNPRIVSFDFHRFSL